MPQAAVQRFYRIHAYFYDSTRWLFLFGRRRAAAALQLSPDGAALEIGCGTGLNFQHVLKALNPRAGRLAGLDFSEDMLRQARRRIAARNWPNVELVQADATRFSLPQRFDGILFAYSLTMIPDWQAALRRARDHLKPGGRLVVLDFGSFRGAGPLGALWRSWLRLNHVETLRPYAEGLRDLFGTIEVHQSWGGYYFIAVGVL